MKDGKERDNPQRKANRKLDTPPVERFSTSKKDGKKIIREAI